VPTAVADASVHISAAPIAPPADTGNSSPNSKPPASTAIVGANINLAARRVVASSVQSRSQFSQRMPGRSACFLHRVALHRPQRMYGDAVHASQSTAEHWPIL